LLPSYREKIWGTAALEPWFPRAARNIGEVWFTFDENRTEDGARLADLIREFGPALLGSACASGRFPILVKFLFTSARLSIQVHPNDVQASLWEEAAARGKSEMWHVLRAAPGAEVALGFREPLTRERLREAAHTGEIEKLIRWFPVQTGDTFLTPAGTVHAIGAGLVLCEIQQNSDITYRLYDWGRARELHIERAVEAALLDPHPGPCEPRPIAHGRTLLASCEHFATELLELEAPAEYRPDPERMHVLVAIEGTGTLDERRFAAGEVWLVPASASPFAIVPEAKVRMLRAYVPG
jgi:mannose-6-phosphate isomerase